MNIRAVFFDFGGVIQRTEFQAPRQQLAQRFGMEYEDLDKLVFGGGPNSTAAKATVGEIDVKEHWKAVAKKLKISDKEISTVESDFFAGDVVDRSLIQFLQSLRPRFMTGLISNAWSDMREYLVRQKLDDVFDHLIISAEVGAAKPDARIYRFALEQAKVKANEAVFVDDVPANIEACERIGMRGVLFRDSQEFMRQLNEILGL
jgi:putative hydrolase of the HAD superfamily